MIYKGCGTGVHPSLDGGGRGLVGFDPAMEVSFRALGLEGDVPGMGFKDFATQARHAAMLEDCPYYLAL